MSTIKKIGFLILMGCLLPAVLRAQQNKGFLSNVEVVSQPGIEELLAKRIEVNKRAPAYGFRLQIYSGSTRNEAYSIQVKFALKYPELGSYLTYETPNYKLRVGDFITRSDAEKVKKMLEKEFDAAFIVSDKLNPDNVYREGATELPY